MRIVAGEFKGRRLTRPSDQRVRITAERVREALFDILAPRLAGARVLDLFAGSGVLGLEAISRGASRVEFVELLPASIAAIRKNIADLGLQDRTSVYRGDAMRYVRRLRESEYDLAIADPPFSSDLGVGLYESYLETAFAKSLAIEHRSDLRMTGGDTRRYGNLALTLYNMP